MKYVKIIAVSFTLAFLAGIAGAQAKKSVELTADQQKKLSAEMIDLKEATKNLPELNAKVIQALHELPEYKAFSEAQTKAINGQKQIEKEGQEFVDEDRQAAGIKEPWWFDIYTMSAVDHKPSDPNGVKK